jgi:putative spermidine/putrescine transport system substrate-binding protein
LKRRSFILGAGVLTLGQLLAACGGEKKSTLQVRLLQNSIPAVVLNQYRKQVQNQVVLDFIPATQLQDIFSQLQAWQQTPTTETSQRFNLPFLGGRKQDGGVSDLVTLGDYWLASAIAQELIQPLDIQKLKQWQQLPPRWQALMQRDRQGNLDPNGAVWGAPYRWGSTAIVYRLDKLKHFDWLPTDWSDLWRPELRDRLSLLDQPREIIGLTLKKLGHSYNTKDFTKVPQLKQELQNLHKLVKFYSSDTYLQPLILGDTWVAVGWSTDILPMLQRYSNLGAIIPASGTALWADLWVRPAAKKETNKKTNKKTNSPNKSKSDDLLSEWINFCWEPSNVEQISLRTKAVSPMLNQNQPNLPKGLQNNSLFNALLLPEADILEKSEFMQPLPPKVAQQYQDLWLEIRRS